jgi:hypothetical protein
MNVTNKATRPTSVLRDAREPEEAEAEEEKVAADAAMAVDAAEEVEEASMETAIIVVNLAIERPVVGTRRRTHTCDLKATQLQEQRQEMPM